MAQLAAVAGKFISAAGTIAAGNAANDAARFEAGQLQRNAGQVRASSQRAAIEERRNADLVASRALAVAASSGAGASDVTVENILGDIEKEGEYRALTALYEGEQQATGMETAAKVRKWEGKMAKRASRLQAVGTLLEAGSSMYGKYGGTPGSEVGSYAG